MSLNRIAFCLSCIIYLLGNNRAAAQSGVIEGRVTDSAGHVLSYASIILYRGPDAVAAAFTKTDPKGLYRLPYNGYVPAQISASAIGYAKQIIPVLPAKHDGAEIIIDFKLYAQSIILNEVNVIDKPKITQKGDTTTYRLSAFTNQTERALEEALAKLPGFKVSETGTISVNGTPIQKILIDGDDLLDKNYKLLSKNLSADLVDKVQVLDKFVNNSLMAGLEKTIDKALNITLKDDRKKLFFGDLGVDGGLKNRYAVLANGIVLTKQTKAYILLNSNNTGVEPLPAQTELPPKTTSLSTPFDPEVNSLLISNIAPAPVPLVDFRRTYINRSLLQSVSIVHKSIPKFLIKGNLNFFSDRNSRQRESFSTLNLGADTLFIAERQSYLKKTLSGDGGLNLAYTFNPRSKLVYDMKSLVARSPETGQLLTDGKQVGQELINRNVKVDQRLNYTWRIAEKKALIVDAAYIHQSTPQDLNISGYNYDFLLAAAGTGGVHQHYLSANNYLGAQLKYYLDLGSATLAYSLGIDRYRQSLHASIRTDDPGASRPGTYNNDDAFSKNDWFIQTSLQKRFGRQWEVTAKLGLHELAGATDAISQTASESPDFHNLSVLPDLNLVYQISRKSKITFNYSYKVNYPDITTLYHQYLLINYRQLTRYSGATALQQEYRTGLNYSYSDVYNQFIAFISSYYSISKNSYTDSLLINGDFILNTRYPSAQDYRLSGLVSGVDKFIPALSSTVRLQTYVVNNRYVNSINAAMLRHISSWTTDAKISLVSAFPAFFNFNASIQYRTVDNKAKSEETATTSTRNSTIKGFFQADFKINKVMFLQCTGTGYRWNNNTASASNLYFLDGGLLWQAVKNKLSFSATLKNALNRQFLSFTNTTDYQSGVSTYTILPRMMLFGFKYQF